MKITNKRLRTIIREALNEAAMNEYEGFHVGSWYKDARGDVGQLTKIFTKNIGGIDVPFVEQRFLDRERTQRFDVWAETAVLATDEEVAKQMKNDAEQEEWMHRNIDTSREGT